MISFASQRSIDPRLWERPKLTLTNSFLNWFGGGFFLAYICKMKATITRQSHAKYTRGKLTVDNGFTCDTLELPWLNNAPRLSCIPAGVYQVVPRRSDKYGYHLHVTGVNSRDLILIHWGNYAGSRNPKSGIPDIKGCILVGYGYADLDGDGLPEIVRSKDAFKALMLACPNGFELTIK